MTIKMERKFKEIETWGGACATKILIWKLDKGKTFEETIEELYPDGIDETTLNDILWFEDEWIMEMYGLTYYEYGELMPTKAELEEYRKKGWFDNFVY